VNEDDIVVDIMKNQLKENLKHLDTMGYSDTDLARYVKVSTPTISRWKAGKSSPHHLMIPKLLEKLEELFKEEK
jgi:predicted transcriptional regulator